MVKIIFLFLSLLLIQNCIGQDNKFRGNWIGCGHWGMNYYKIKKNQKVLWYSNGCIDRGTRHRGTWKNTNDTITLTFEKREIKYILKEGKLCYYSEDGNHGEASNGITQTKRFTIFGAINNCRKERKRIYD